MSYTIEVYRGNQKAERNFGIYALYVMFYPQLVAGPIERPQNILHQFYEKHKFSYDNVTNGLKLMTWGFFKKIVISDRLADLVNQAYSDPHRYQGFPLILSTIFFAFQIYCDFSGYSDIAIGAARVMGFDLMRNFNKPYSAKSIVEFWQRWHISLSTWFRDYLYIPLGGSRVKMSRRYLNLLITFLISGLWHGANWTYIVWGGLNGVYQIIDISTKKARGKIESIISSGFKPAYSILCQLVTFLLICTTWVFFRARSVQDGWYIVSHFITSVHGTTALYLSAKNMMDILFALIALFILFGVEHLQKNQSFVDFVNKKSPAIRWGFYYGLVLIIFLLGKFEGNQQFIYFQF
ncbi:MBOAT family protein [Mucilaginibacter sp. OK268]|uniref:MBOAT family O-acyltransferase n=1 Tax=Mucilaginibacter sp. OK268 TaxID=1881048 RepID=UPI0021007CB4|nr:MBOAT family O-acyltransferase [Mucilaginibacter sp. OK268]